MAGGVNQGKTISLFYSYSHRDEELRDRLEEHLGGLRRRGLIENWHDRRIGAGSEWKDAIDEHLATADIILLLISSSFINSDYCWDKEMTKALARHDKGEARVIPVVLKPCYWQESLFARLQMVPRDAKPITSWPDPDEAFVQSSRRSMARSTRSGSAVRRRSLRLYRQRWRSRIGPRLPESRLSPKHSPESRLPQKNLSDRRATL